MAGQKPFNLECDAELLCVWRLICHPHGSDSGKGKIVVYRIS